MSTTVSIVLALLAAMTGGGFLGFIQFLMNRKDGKDEWKEDIKKGFENVNSRFDRADEDLSHIKLEIADISKKLDIQTELNICEGRSILKQKNDKYREMGFIPDDEYPVYKALGEAYINAGGNSNVKTMFLRNMDKLPVQQPQYK